MKNRNGFTLIELLAVIVILAVIALISTPLIMSAVEQAKAGAVRSSTYGYMEAIELYVFGVNSDDVTSNDIPTDGAFNWAGNVSSIVLKGDHADSANSLVLNRGRVVSGTMTFGDYTATIINGIVTDVSKGPVMAQGLIYKHSTIAYDYETAVNQITFANGSDEDRTAIELGFSFPFVDDTYSTIYVQTNGIISFDDFDAGYEASKIKYAHDHIIAPLWDDLDTANVETSGVFYTIGVEEGKNYIVIEYRDVVFYGGTDSISFEAKLYDDGTIKFSYKDINGGMPGYDYGEYASIGVRVDGTNYNSYSFQTASLTDNLTVLYELLPGTIEIVTGTPETCFEFDFDTNTITKYLYDGEECGSNVFVPATIEGMAVTSLGHQAFGYLDLTSITIPEGIITIGDHALRGNLFSSITLPSTLKSIGSGALSGLPITSITLPDGLISIGEEAFMSDLLTAVTIPASVETIGTGAFVGNKLIQGQVVFDSVMGDVYFDTYTFSNNDADGGADIVPVYLHDYTGGVTPESCFAFSAGTITDYLNTNPGCGRYVIIPSTIGGISVTTIGYSAFGAKKIFHVTIPSSVTSIETYAFESNTILEVVLPNTLTTLGSYIFKYNYIKNITIPTNWTNIPRDMFNGNIISDLTIPSGITTISSYAFNGNQISSLVIPNTVTDIGESAFGWNNIASLDIPSTLTTLGNYAFMHNKITSLTFPNNMTTIPYGAFSYNQLTSVSLPSTLTIIYGDAFYANDIRNLTIPNNVTYIGDGAFSFNYNLGSVTIPSNVTSLSGFAYCGLNSVTIPASVTTIGANAFNSNHLTSITLPSGVASIGTYSFSQNRIPQDSAIYKNPNITIGLQAFDYNGADGNTTISPVYIP